MEDTAKDAPYPGGQEPFSDYAGLEFQVEKAARKEEVRIRDT